MKIESNYKDGKLDGRKTEWYKDGEVKSVSYYDNSKLKAKREFWDNGELKSKSNYKDGKFGVGIFKVFRVKPLRT